MLVLLYILSMFLDALDYKFTLKQDSHCGSCSLFYNRGAGENFNYSTRPTSKQKVLLTNIKSQCLWQKVVLDDGSFRYTLSINLINTNYPCLVVKKVRRN